MVELWVHGDGESSQLTPASVVSLSKPYEGWDCQEPALRYAFEFIGVTDIQFIHANGLDLGDEARQRGLSEAESKIHDLVTNW